MTCYYECTSLLTTDVNLFSTRFVTNRLQTQQNIHTVMMLIRHSHIHISCNASQTAAYLTLLNWNLVA